MVVYFLSTLEWSDGFHLFINWVLTLPFISIVEKCTASNVLSWAKSLLIINSFSDKIFRAACTSLTCWILTISIVLLFTCCLPLLKKCFSWTSGGIHILFIASYVIFLFYFRKKIKAETNYAGRQFVVIGRFYDSLSWSG